MGTRNLTCVALDGEYKIAQYGQWEGYPGGQGMTALEFLRMLVKSPTKVSKFTEKVKALGSISAQEIDDLESFDSPNFENKYPYLCRNMGAEILDFVLKFKGSLRLYNSIEFAGDSLFCEWAYVIDLDKKTFEVYAGFNQKSLSSSERFFNYNAPNKDYCPIKLLVSFPMDKLPTPNRFVSICGDLYTQRRESDKLPDPSPDAMVDGLGI